MWRKALTEMARREFERKWRIRMVAESIVRLNSRIAEVIRQNPARWMAIAYFLIAYQLFGDGSRHPLLRKQAVDSMRTDPSMREFMSETGTNTAQKCLRVEFLRPLRHPALARQYKLAVTIISSIPNPEYVTTITPSDSQSENGLRRVYLAHLAEFQL